jgi:hypothetical protein
MRIRTFLLAVTLAACGGFPDPREQKPTAPAANDTAYEVKEIGEWYVTSDAAQTQDELMTIFVAAPAGTDFIDVWIGDLGVQRLAKQPDGRFAIQTSIAELPPGEHDVLLAANGETTAFARVPFKRSAPYYVLVTTDWDFADPGDQANRYQEFLHQNHPELVMTHFVGPYTFTDPAVTPARRAELAAWVVAQRDMHGDEIGLHIHPYCNFVTSAGLTCIIDQSTVFSSDDTGYTINLGAYGRADMATLLEHAKTLFQQNGLGTPRTFRAGGWTATLDTVAALADTGFIADTSALNWARIEEWEGKELYRWNMENWAPINDTSQPYYPSQNNVLTNDAPTLAILEVPDNGVMIDYVSLPEMNSLFDANFDGQPLLAPRTLMMGFHPATPGFTESEYLRVDGFLKYSDMYLASKRKGPVVYITLEDVVPAFPR